MGNKTICGYLLGDIIGEGGQAKVRLGYNPQQKEYAAIKILRKSNTTMQVALKEFRIHKSITHRNIINMYASAEDSEHIYFVLEYAAAGELFEKIEPDIGIDEEVAHLYFHQLLNAMSYLHEHGICHRDLKPENMLLDEFGNLKISDFGLATVFKHKGQVRILNTPCGSPPYLAPEVKSMHYWGDRIDIWSCGIILFVLLVGNTPWAEPSLNDEEFSKYSDSFPDQLNYYPWNCFSESVLEILVGLLNVDPAKRFEVYQIKKLTWFRLPNSLMVNGMVVDSARLADRLRSRINSNELSSSQTIAYSQPADIRYNSEDDNFETQRAYSDIHSFSQPLDFDSSSVCSKQIVTTSASPFSCKSSFLDLFPQITRFYSKFSTKEILLQIGNTLDDFLIPWRKMSTFSIAFTTVDKRKCPLHGDISIQPLKDVKIVSFRKRKGDPLEFKRLFRAILGSSKNLVLS